MIQRVVEAGSLTALKWLNKNVNLFSMESYEPELRNEMNTERCPLVSTDELGQMIFFHAV